MTGRAERSRHAAADPADPAEHLDAPDDARHDASPGLGDFIKTQREIARMSVRRLADLAGVSNPYLSQIERGLRRPSAEILQQLARALQISAESLYVRAGLLSDEAGSGDGVRDAVARDPALTPEQRTALLGVYDSFVAANLAANPAANVAAGSTLPSTGSTERES